MLLRAFHNRKMNFCEENKLTEVEREIRQLYEDNIETAKAGNEESMLMIAKYYKRYADYYSDEKAGESALATYKELAKNGNSKAFLELGHCYMNGILVDKQEKMGAYLYQKACDLKCAEAAYFLGKCYEEGKGVRENLTSALLCYQRSAEWGDATAEAELGIVYYEGKGVERDREQAYKWLKHSFEQGELKGIYYLAICYFNGFGTKIDCGKGFSVLENSIHNICYQKDEAELLLIDCYEKGIGTQRDMEKAKKIRDGKEELIEIIDKLVKIWNEEE